MAAHPRHDRLPIEPARRGRGHAAMTLVEMLVAMAASIVLLGLVAQMFSMLGSGVNGSRNSREMADRLRAVQFAIRHDLSGASAMGLQPPVSAEANAGYFELIEGTETDTSSYFAAPGASDDRLRGDCDDILAFTTRTAGEPFVGKVDATSTAQSPYAEVIYFCRYMAGTQNPRMSTLHRRQRLVMAYPGAGAFAGTNTAPLNVDTDFSCRVVAGRLVPNTLGDLSKRENRFMRTTAFPYDLDLSRQDEFTHSGLRQGEDIVLTNVIGFDVRVFDPGAEVRRLGDITLNPGDPGYGTAASAGLIGTFVDLNWSGASKPLPFTTVFPPAGGAFQGRGVSVRNNGIVSLALPTYDTWSNHYETNGVDDDRDEKIDQRFNQQDDNRDGRIDEPAEAETQAPYPVPLRGIEIRIRCYEPTSKQIRQITVRHAL
ncbi:MAG: type II secretion system protein J [Planctomycetia bacterium]